MALAERLKWLAPEIWVKKEEAYDLLEPLSSRLGIKLYIVGELEALEDAQPAMWEFMGLPGLP